jgi:RNA polymerase sigma-70 factor, ECF subfamily
MVVDSTALWVELHQSLRGFVARRISNQIDVDDLVQEIFLRIHSRIHTLDDAERVQAWVYQIARNVIVDYYRGNSQRREQLVDTTLLDLEQEPETSEETLGAELAQCVTPLLNQLSASYRTALELTELGGLTQQEAARQLGLSHSGMKSRVQRGRQQLRQRLLECCEVELDRRGGVIEYAAHETTCGCGDRCGCHG